MEDQNEPIFKQTMQTNLNWLAKDYGKMETISVQWEKNLLEIDNLFAIEIIVDWSQHWHGNCSHELWVHIQELKGKLETLRKALGKVFQDTYMDNQLKKFRELLLDNALLKVQNQTLANENPKWKEWWQIV